MTDLERNIIKPCLLAAHKVYEGAEAEQLCKIAEGAMEILVEMIVGMERQVLIPTQTYAEFEKMNELLDEIALSFPIINNVEVTVGSASITRTERTAYRTRVIPKRVQADLSGNDCG